MFRAMVKAAELLARRGMASRETDMVLFAMLEDDLTYDEAVDAFAEYEGRSRTEIETAMDEAARRAEHWTGAKRVLEDCYREAVR